MRWHEKINRWLASSVSELNAFLACMIVVAVTLTVGNAINNSLLGFVFGIVAGAFVAVLVCGILAILIDIRNSLARRD